MAHPEFDCRLRRLNWPRSAKEQRFIDGARMVLVNGLSANAAAAMVPASRDAVRLRCIRIASVRLADSKPTYYIYMASRQRCLGFRKTLAGARRVRRAALLVREWLRRPKYVGRFLYAETEDVALYVAEPDGRFGRLGVVGIQQC